MEHSRSRRLLFLVLLIFFTVSANSQALTKRSLQTNARDTITVTEMFSTDDGLGDGIRTYKRLGKDLVFIADTMHIKPKYFGDYKAFSDTLFKTANLLYSDTRRTITVEFIVEYNGSLSHIRVLWSEKPAIDKQLIKFIKSFPKWNPGISNNKYVRAMVRIPI